MGTIPRSADKGAGLVAFADLGHVKPRRREPRSERVYIQRLPGEPTESIGGFHIRRGAETPADFDGDAADAEEQEADAPLLECAVEGQPKTQAFAVESARLLDGGTVDDHMVEMVNAIGAGDRRLRPSVPFIDERDVQLPGRGGVDAQLLPAQIVSRLAVRRRTAVSAASHRARRPDVPVREGCRPRPKAWKREADATQSFFPGRRNRPKLEMHPLESEDRKLRVRLRIDSADPGRRTPQQKCIVLTRLFEIVHADDGAMKDGVHEKSIARLFRYALHYESRVMSPDRPSGHPPRLGSRLLLSLSLVLAMSILATGCRDEATPAPSVVLVTIDHVEADRLGCFGGPPQNGKSLCALAKGGTLLAWSLSPGGGLASTAATVLTGTPQSVHGVDDRGLSFLPDRQTTIAEALRERGYRTAAFVTSQGLNQIRRLDQGFDRYAVFDENGDGLREAVDGFVGQGDEPFFLWLHLTQPVDEEGRAGLADLDRKVAELSGILRRADPAPALLLTGLRGLPETIPGIGLASHRVPAIWRPAPLPGVDTGRAPAPRVRFGLSTLADFAPTLMSVVAGEPSLFRALEEDQPRGRAIGGTPEKNSEPLLLLMDSSHQEVGLASAQHFYVRSRGDFDGTGQPMRNDDLAEKSARFVALSKTQAPGAALAFSPWREDVLAEDSPVPRFEFELARRLQDARIR